MTDRMRKSKRLGDVLLQRGSLSLDSLNRAVTQQNQQEKDMRLGEILLKEGYVSKTEIGTALEQIQGIPYANCPPESVDQSILELLSPATALRCCAMPLEIKGRKLLVAMAEPQNLALLDELRFSVGMPITPRFSFREDIILAIGKFYGEAEPEEEIVEESSEEVSLGRNEDDFNGEIEFLAEDLDDESTEAQRELNAGIRKRTPAVMFLSKIMVAAVEKQASDIHIEPRASATTVRVRIDGILRELMTMPSEHQAAVVSRIKILSNMDISERRVPQDGRFMMRNRDRRLDLRVSTLPTHFGEKVVIRILDPKSTMITLDQLGFSSELAANLNRILAMPQGMLLVTGPTGSGKSTTLYGSLNLLRSPRNNIVTVEDPVEFMLEGVNQVQVHPKAGLTFATCLPSILRQDPDVIMVGEIRNGETAEIAMNASQTGHLVLSTLHTNDSVGAVTRLLDLGVPSYLIAASLTGVLAQRLVRRLCSCRTEKPASKAYHRRLEKIGAADTRNHRIEYETAGCDVCENTGYKGRVGIYEILMIEGAVRDAVHGKARADEILSLARCEGFKTMQEDALDKVRTGLTSIEEVQRVVPTDASKPQRCPACSKEVTPTFSFCPFCGTRNEINAGRPEPVLAGR